MDLQQEEKEIGALLPDSLLSLVSKQSKLIDWEHELLKTILKMIDPQQSVFFKTMLRGAATRDLNLLIQQNKDITIEEIELYHDDV